MLENAHQPPEDYAALKAWAMEKAAALEETRRDLLQAQTGLVSATLLIEKLKIELAPLRRETYGASSEKLARIDQLELQLEDLEETVAAGTPARAQAPLHKPVRRPLPDHLPRHDVTHEPALAGDGCSCPGCGGRLSRLGEDATEELEYAPASFRVVRHLRPKYACRACEVVHQAPMPSRPMSVGGPVPASWPRCCWPSTMTTCPCTARARSTLAKAWSWSALPWPTGWDAPPRCWRPWLRRSART